MDVQTDVHLFPDYDLESASERADALKLKEHIFEVMEDIPLETVSQTQQQRVRKQIVDQIVNTHASQTGFPAAFCCVNASVLESRYSSSFLSTASATICDSIDGQLAWAFATRKSSTDVRYFGSFD